MYLILLKPRVYEPTLFARHTCQLGSETRSEAGPVRLRCQTCPFPLHSGDERVQQSRVPRWPGAALASGGAADVWGPVTHAVRQLWGNRTRNSEHIQPTDLSRFLKANITSALRIAPYLNCTCFIHVLFSLYSGIFFLKSLRGGIQKLCLAFSVFVTHRNTPAVL